MTNIWFTSDSHFRHSNFLTFKDETGSQIRKFANVGEMDDCMITRWNERVNPQGDKVYHLGDVGFDSSNNARILPMLHGSKNLILGNHDTIKGDLIHHFKKLVLWRLFKEQNFICSHVPLREDSMYKVTYNCHGHIHQQPSPSIRHIHLCVENTNYAPVHLDEILAEISRRNNIIEHNIPYMIKAYDWKVSTDEI
jgi:calcineurin-like phosphoesterase family protein